MTDFTKVPDFTDFSDSPKNSDFGPFLSQNSRLGNILDAFKFDYITSATLYLPFNTKVKALPFLVLDYVKF